MKIKIKENELRDIIKKHIIEFLNQDVMYECWDKLSKPYITEGLTCTYSINKIKNILKRRYDFKTMNIVWGELDNNPNSNDMFKPFAEDLKTTKESDNWYSFTLMFRNGVNDKQNIIRDIIHTCDACGWYLSDGVYFLRNGLKQDINVKNNETIDFEDKTLQNTPLMLKFRAKFNAEYKQQSIPPFIYHICPLRVVDKILKQGLTPRNNGRIASHPERVYLFLEYPKNWIENIAKNFKISGKDEKYCLLEIDTRNLNDVKFYYDSNIMLKYPAVYTLEPIPPTAIRVEDKEN